MRKRILILGHNYVTQFIDIVNQYARVFPQDKFEVTAAYLTGEPNAEVKQRTRAEHVEFLHVPKKNIRYLKLKAIRKLLTLCREKNFDLVICHRYKPTYIMLWVAQFCRIPALVFVMHELHTMSHLNRQLLIAALQRKNMLFAGVSNAVRDDMRQDLWGVPKEQVITLYNMIDVALTQPHFLSKAVARAKLGLSPEHIIFGNVARLAANKDQQTLIRAFAEIKSACPNAKLVIIGDGELELQLKTQVIALGLKSEVIFTGFLPQGFCYMRAFDCFVLSSSQEAFGRVLIEAMIANLPVIATRVHGVPEVVADVGILVNAKDVDGLAAAMQRIYLLSDSERQALGTRAHQHAVENFSVTTFQEHFWDVLGQRGMLQL